MMSKVSHLYIHIPFCDYICAYCDFYRLVYRKKLVEQFLWNVACEIKKQNISKNLKTIYIGGGTPSSLTDEQLETLFSIIEPYAQFVEEYTIEANMDSLTKSKVELMVKHKINRISLGIQSFNETLQKKMQRECDPKYMLDTIDMVYQQGIKNISVDLIYGFENQTLQMWDQDLTIIKNNPYISHISLYSLTIEPNSQFKRDNVQTVSNEMEAHLYQHAIKTLQASGFEHYEIASFAKNKLYSKHNLAYWTYQNFYGIGPGASGKIDDYRYDNIKNIVRYNQGHFIQDKTYLSKEEQIFERIMMNLRIKWGICLEAINKEYQINFLKKFEKQLSKMVKLKWLQITDTHVYVEEDAKIFLHDILIEFME